jgi:hypothetical protein
MPERGLAGLTKRIGEWLGMRTGRLEGRDVRRLADAMPVSFLGDPSMAGPGLRRGTAPAMDDSRA